MQKKTLLAVAAGLLALVVALVGITMVTSKTDGTATEVAVTETETDSAVNPEPTDCPEMDNLRAAQEANSDTVAWIVIPGTDINEVVVQAEDNDYYLRRNALGEDDQWGCTFSDYINVMYSRDALNPNSILYGHSHNSEDPTLPQFTQLFHYTDIDFLKENPAFYIYLTNGDKLTFQIAAVFYTDIGFDYIEPTPDDSYYETVEAKNEYVFDNVTIGPEDKLMTLSTCSYKYDVNDTHNHRFVVVGKLLPKGEEPVEPQVSANPDPERPVA